MRRATPAGRRRTCGSSLPPSIWSSATIAARTTRGLLLFKPAAVVSRIADLDQGISERMLERAVTGRAGGGQKRGHGGLVADSPQGLGGGAAVVHRRGFEQLDELRAGPAVAPEPGRMDRGLADGFVGVGQKSAGHFACGRIVDPGQRPDGVAPQGRATARLAVAPRAAKRGLLVRRRGQGFDRQSLDGRARVVEKLDELGRRPSGTAVVFDCSRLAFPAGRSAAAFLAGVTR